MKIAYCIGGIPFGGVESWLLDICLRIKQGNKHQCRVFNISGTGLKTPEYLEKGVDVVCIGSSKRSINIHRMDTLMRLRSALQEYQPDIIHTLHFSGDYFGRLAALGLGIPVVTHLRNIKHERKMMRRLANKLLSFATDRYFSVSQAVADLVEQDHNMANKPSVVLYNAVDPHKLAIPAHDLHSMYGVSGKILLGVGRYVPQKNYALLLSALRLLLDQGYDASLVLVGEGSERPNLEQQIADLHLHGRAVLTGYRQDVPAFLQSADVFVMPSDFEGLPIAHVEAMFCGLPAVVSRYVPSLEIAGASSLVCKRSPESIAEQVRRLLDDENLRQELAEQGKRIAQEYTIDKYMVKMFEQYEQVLSQRS